MLFPTNENFYYDSCVKRMNALAPQNICVKTVTFSPGLMSFLEHHNIDVNLDVAFSMANTNPYSVNHGFPFYVKHWNQTFRIGDFVSADTSRIPLMMEYNQDKDFLICTYTEHDRNLYTIATYGFKTGLSETQSNIEFKDFGCVLDAMGRRQEMWFA